MMLSAYETYIILQVLKRENALPPSVVFRLGKTFHPCLNNRFLTIGTSTPSGNPMTEIEKKTYFSSNLNIMFILFWTYWFIQMEDAMHGGKN